MNESEFRGKDLSAETIVDSEGNLTAYGRGRYDEVFRIGKCFETLRDRFAMAALVGMPCSDAKEAAAMCYEFADAMLAERAKK